MWSWYVNEIAHLNLHLTNNVIIKFIKIFREVTEAATGGVLRNFAKFPGKHLCQSLFFNKINYFWDRYFPVNFAKFLRIPYLLNAYGRLLLKRNKTKCLPSLIAFSSLSDINVTLKIGITLTWSFTLRYTIATKYYDVGKRYYITIHFNFNTWSVYIAM